VKETFFTVVNPGHALGPWRRRAGNLRSGVLLRVEETWGTQANCLEAYQTAIAARRGRDGIIYEIVNGLFPGAEAGERPTVAVLPLGTGNSFLQDFTPNARRNMPHAQFSKAAGACDVLRMKHRGGVIHYINLLSVGRATPRRSQSALGHVGHLLG
jgi:hypothetical protein